MSLPGQRQYHLWEECPVAIASHNNAVHLQYPSPYPSPNLWPCSVQPHASYFHPGAAAQMTERDRPSGRLDILDCATCWLAGWIVKAQLFLWDKMAKYWGLYWFLQYWFSYCVLLGVVFLWRASEEQETTIQCFCTGILAPWNTCSFVQIYKYLHRICQLMTTVVRILIWMKEMKLFWLYVFELKP